MGDLIADTDGDGYADSITIVPNGIQVVHACTGRTSFYAYYGVSFSLSSAEDTDGQPGAEILVLWAGANGANGINVIHDRTGVTTQYSYQGLQFSINSVTDTDGQPGAEIIVLWAGALGSNGIDVIHDRTGTTNPYTLNTTFAIGGVRDYDGIAGAEICYSWFSVSTRYSMIVDRTQTIVARTGC